MSNELDIHRRQFVIGPQKIKYSNRWRSIEISDGVYFSYCETLPVKKGYDKSGNIFLLIGIAVQVAPKRDTPIKELEFVIKTPEEVYDSWAGRWILIYNNEIHLDFSALLGSYYTFVNEDLWISSSVSILKDLAGNKARVEVDLSKYRMNWIPLPFSRLSNVRTLLPSQILKITTGNIRARQLFPDYLVNQSEKEAMDNLDSYLKTAILNISKLNKNIWIPLSAGYDSRLLLAAAISANVPIKTYTMKKKNTWAFFNKNPQTSPVSKADMTIPPLLAKEVGTTHKWIYQKEYNPNLLSQFDKHTYGQTIENDRTYYSYGQWDWVSDNDIILLGQVFEMGHCHYYNFLEYSNNNISKLSIVESFDLKGSNFHSKAFDEYIKWISKYSESFNDSVDWRDRFYLEQRLAGWLSSLQQGMDLIRGERIHLANSQRVICTLLSLPEETRMNLLHQKELIKMMAPELLKYPFNPPDPFFYKINKTISIISRRPLKSLFTKRTIKKLIKGSKK